MKQAIGADKGVQADEHRQYKKKTSALAMGQSGGHSVLTAGCLFSGIGGFCAGLQQAGIKVLWANENDAYATQTYSHNYPEIRLMPDDIRNLSVKGDCLSPVDILTAGFPCQSFSQAGDKKGFDDPRGNLFFEIPRIIREFGKKKPLVLLLENVPYLRCGGQGQWFDSVIREIRMAGYWFGSRNCTVLNTAEITKLPHRRKRLFMVGMSTDAFYCNNFRFPSPGRDPVSLSNLLDKNKKQSDIHYMDTSKHYGRIILRKMSEGDSNSIYQLRRSYVRENNSECPTLTANMGEGGHNVPFIKDRWGVRKLTVVECAKLQGLESIEFPESIPENQRYKQIGNAVSVPVAYQLALECVRVLAPENRA